MREGERQSSVLREHDSENLMDTVDLNKISLGVRRRFWVIILFGALFAAGAGGVTWSLMNQWKAEALILYRQDNKLQRLPGGYTLNAFSLPTVVEMIQLPAHFDAVRSILGLNLPPEAIGRMVEVEAPKRNSDIIRLICATDNPTLAIDVCNTLASVAVKHSLDIKNKQLQVAKEFYQSQLESAQGKLTKQLDAISKFKKEHDFIEMTVDDMGSAKNLDEAEERLRQANVDYDSLLVQYENLKREVEKIPDHVVRLAYEDDPLKDRITQTELALLQARTRYASDNPKVKVLEEELNQLRQMVAKSSFDDTKEKVYEKNQLKADLNLELVRLQGKLRSAQKIKEELQDSLTSLKKQMVDLPELQVSFSELLEQKQAAQEEVKSMAESLRTTELMMTVGKGDIELYQVADKAERYMPKLVRFLPLIGFIFGVMVGFFYLLIREVLDKRLRTGREMAIDFTIPCLQSIPELRHFNRKQGEEVSLLYIRAIAERLAHLRGKFKSLAVLSSLQGEGKSSLAYYLATYYVRLGLKTLYVNFDSRPNPHVDEAEMGVANDAWQGRLPLDRAVVAGEPDRMRVAEDARMKEVLLSKEMENAWEELQRRYDRIILDAPGVVEDDYAVNVGALAEVRLFVCSSRVQRRYAETALETLGACGIVPDAMVLNRVPSTYVDDLRLKFEKRRQRARKKWFNFSIGKKKVDNVKA